MDVYESQAIAIEVAEKAIGNNVCILHTYIETTILMSTNQNQCFNGMRMHFVHSPM